ncbi:bloodthirsty-related gene family, member 32 [Lepisosteus oculatus]|uniref:E3 ubiquitin-protein ligase Midline-1-like n=1 Tax=Lepisosteus oculatus TaxID=7918 RepID=W5MD82_LEPOC|nr:PREDICTED: E3 ubiquitin-protein ligase Midline-1-like [Lepisosteus oculatus]
MELADWLLRASTSAAAQRRNRPGRDMEPASLQEELLCAVCRDVFVEPVTLPCGHNYCEACVQQLRRSAAVPPDSAKRRRAYYPCPLCLAPCEATIELRKNVALRNIVQKCSVARPGDVPCSVCKGRQRPPAERSCVTCGESYCALHVMPHSENEFFRQHVLVRPTRDTGRLCEEHGKDLELFCATDGTPLCAYCMLPGESRHLGGHDVVKLSEAAHVVKEGCLAKLENVEESLSEIGACLLKLEEVASLTEENIKKQQQGYTGFLSKIKLLLDIEEEAWRKRFSVEMVQESRRIKYRVEKLKVFQGQLQEAGAALEKALVVQDPVTLLKLLKNADWNDLYQREFCSSKIQETMESVGIPSTASKRQTPLFMALQKAFAAEEIKLDPRTAHPHLKISKDYTAVCATREKHTEGLNTERFRGSYCVLGTAAFSRGVHYWEVTVRDLPSWALGITYRSITRDPPGCWPGSDDKSWALSYSGSRRQFCAQHDWLAFSFGASRAPERIGLFLDCDSGILAFYDAHALECLYPFYCSLKLPVYPVFCPQLEGAAEFVTAEMRVERPAFL